MHHLTPYIPYIPFVCAGLAFVGAVYSVLRLARFILTEREFVRNLARDRGFREFVHAHDTELDPNDRELRRMKLDTRRLLLDIMDGEVRKLEPAKRRPIGSALHQPYEPSRLQYAARLANEGRKLVLQH